ncbi:hypothetical protein ACFX2I_035761 [Malus domestica]
MLFPPAPAPSPITHHHPLPHHFRTTLFPLAAPPPSPITTPFPHHLRTKLLLQHHHHQFPHPKAPSNPETPNFPPTFITTSNPCLDFFFQVVLFIPFSWKEDPTLLGKPVFRIRTPRFVAQGQEIVFGVESPPMTPTSIGGSSESPNSRTLPPRLGSVTFPPNSPAGCRN